MVVWQFLARMEGDDSWPTIFSHIMNVPEAQGKHTYRTPQALLQTDASPICSNLIPATRVCKKSVVKTKNHRFRDLNSSSKLNGNMVRRGSVEEVRELSGNF